MNKKEINRFGSNKNTGSMRVEDIAPYAKSNCKECHGRGYKRFVTASGDFLSNDVCMCVWKGKKSQEFIDRVNRIITSDLKGKK